MYSFAIKDRLESLHCMLVFANNLQKEFQNPFFEKFLHLFHYGLLSPQVHIVHCTKNSIYIFPEMKLRGLDPNSYIHVYSQDRSAYLAAAK